MKLKYYLRGLGIGIIVTTVILAVSFSKKEIKMSDEEIMARAAQLGMVMQETETTEQGDTEQDPDGTDTGAKTEVVTEQTASELLEERTAAEETAQNTEAAVEDQPGLGDFQQCRGQVDVLAAGIEFQGEAAKQQ